jgi:hypothetical protein
MAQTSPIDGAYRAHAEVRRGKVIMYLLALTTHNDVRRAA